MADRNTEKLDFFLIISVVLVAMAGVLTLYTQEANTADGLGRWYKQFTFVFVGLISMWFMSRINYQLIGSYALFIYIFSIVLLVLTLIPGIGYLPSGRGARSWLKLGPITLQASEFSKLATVILLGQYLVLKEKEMHKITVLIIPFIICLVPMLFIILQPDFGTAVSFLPMLFTMLYLGGADILHVGSLLTFGGISLMVPMYLAYSQLTLIQPLIDLLRKDNKVELVSLVNQLQGKIWLILDGKKVSGLTLPGIENPKNLQMIREAAEIVKDEYASVGYKILSNEAFMFGLGGTLALISLVMIFIRIARGSKHLRNYYITIGILGLSILSAIAVHKSIPFRENQVIRLTAFLNPDQFKQGAGYQLRASKPAVGSGKVFGKGLFHGEMTEGRVPHVPESGTDFIFASWAEQTGFFGSVLLLFFLMSIPLRGLQISFESKDRFGSLLAAGIVAMIFFHIAINVGIVIGLLPVTGVPLTFMSYGGSHLVMAMTAVGIILSIKKRKFAN
ncbi:MULTISPECIES: rod shape-determining protein RodA [Leptospira]|uniref:Rod shape-determining protein RodA n=2 Tax=Leptospira TaxID=171 RepID=A0A6N4PXI3_9LEPT|nr:MULTISPECIES: rod shape-determining protein RodA [Leptospira]MCW7468734.1 rod shape-determining protein RodA [Leptospira kanakyensis]MCW7479727.1 rod shape-determining protein RodA [Leptospira kanakyensis]TGK49964.1 rod shape-determining protein RodA [Leptospira kanakyensis]TGK58519.1 rod shape-determining protein RodA [Leptospira kanakyensis]TGK69102.1 rod shape-determining protein RodA [Leptospira kanakyensis]